MNWNQAISVARSNRRPKRSPRLFSIPLLAMPLLLAMGTGWHSAAFAETASLESGLLAYLPLTEDLLDHSKSQLPVSVTGRVAVVQQAAFFPGESDWLELPHIDLHNRPFAVALWVHVIGRNPMYGLVEQRDKATRNEWLHLMLRGAWQPFLGQFLTDAVSPVSLRPYTWAHLVFQHDGQRQQIWINGAMVVARRCELYNGADGATCIGKSPRWSNVPSKNFEGFLRDVRIYGRVLQADEMAALSGTPARPAALASDAPNVEVEPNVKAAHIGVPFLSIDGNKLTITGENRQIYDIEATEQVGGVWQPLMSVTNRGVPLELTDTDMPSSGRRFYRIKVRDTVPPGY